MAQYFCAAYQLIKERQTQKKNLSDPSNDSEETKHAAYIYLQQHSKPDTDKFIATFDALKTKLQVVPNCNYGDSDINEFFKSWVVANKETRERVEIEDFNNLPDKILDLNDASAGNIFLFFESLKYLVDTLSRKGPLEEIIIKDIPEKQEPTIEICDKELSEKIAASNITEKMLPILDNTLDIVPITGDNSDSDDNV